MITAVHKIERLESQLPETLCVSAFNELTCTSVSYIEIDEKILYNRIRNYQPAGYLKGPVVLPGLG
jgi:hypothetical protein